MKISIVTVSYNSEKTIKNTIESVLNQTYKDIEYIIIDGNSKDNTVKIIKSYEEKFREKEITYRWVSEPDEGIYYAMNKGIKMATGEIIGIINSDDWYELDALSKIYEKHTKEKFDMIYGDIRIVGQNKEFIKKARLEKVVTTRHWNHPTTFINKKIYEKYNYKCESINDDLDLLLKIRKSNFKVTILNEVLANFRLGGISNEKSLKNVFRNIKNRNRIYKNNGYSWLYYIDNAVIEIGKYILS